MVKRFLLPAICWGTVGSIRGVCVSSPTPGIDGSKCPLIAMLDWLLPGSRRSRFHGQANSTRRTPEQSTICPPLTSTQPVLLSVVAPPLPTTQFSFDGSSLPIESVTVYRPSGAQVIRELGVDLKVSTVKLGRIRPVL